VRLLGDAGSGLLRLAAEVAHDGDEGGEGVGNFDERELRPVGDVIGGAVARMFGAQGGRHQDGGGPAGCQVPCQPFAFDEGDVSGTGLAQRTGVADLSGAVAMNLSLDQSRQLLDRDHHFAHPFFLKGALKVGGS